MKKAFSHQLHKLNTHTKYCDLVTLFVWITKREKTTNTK